MINGYHNHNQHNFTEKMQRCQEYIEALEKERCKIQVFERELPLCLDLVTQAIESCRQQLSGTTTTTEYFHGLSECSEQTSSEVPVLEQFIPIKRSSCSDDDEEQSEKPQNNNKDSKSNDKSSKKSDWLKSVQLWNQTPDLPTKEDSPTNLPVIEVKKNGGGAFHPFKKEKNGGTIKTDPRVLVPATAASSTTEIGGGDCGGSGDGDGKKEEKEGQSQRKARRCWSPELHRRFLHALQQLGGSHVATPKQIRELMMVDGLTNDEVKSHLQKYRLHTRRPTPSTQNNNNPQQPQFVVVGGIWVPPPEYAAVAASGEASGVAMTNGIYAPIAAPPPPPTQRQQYNQSNQSHSGEMGSHSEGGGGRCNSPATTSSTHTSTASLAF
ncbi:Myb family transcription factor EFM like [Actinidia chinensis var. chinensis]|uniref:Myb family transcription factor EFM like n=1 Tax=Actinidia chinensis var. chinensis TaxID=1590841 RepID=A0A2R6PH37_ACTCC|nr:Myb family transcription factor EFM like [Actinidia chinensis var. chinensis]